jgi:hypothetical protein
MYWLQSPPPELAFQFTYDLTCLKVLHATCSRFWGLRTGASPEKLWGAPGKRTEFSHIVDFGRILVFWTVLRTFYGYFWGFVSIDITMFCWFWVRVSVFGRPATQRLSGTCTWTTSSNNQNQLASLSHTFHHLCKLRTSRRNNHHRLAPPLRKHLEKKTWCDSIGLDEVHMYRNIPLRQEIFHISTWERIRDRSYRVTARGDRREKWISPKMIGGPSWQTQQNIICTVFHFFTVFHFLVLYFEKILCS